jgi:hypothetical protein
MSVSKITRANCDAVDLLSAVWPFIPQNIITETLEWRTDVIRTKADEQRIGLRANNLLTYEYTYRLTARLLAQAKLFAQAYRQDNFYIPLWWELTNLPDRVHAGATSINFDTRFTRYCQCGLFIIWENETKYEIRQIDTLTNTSISFIDSLDDSYLRPVIMPVYPAIFKTALQITRTSSDISDASASFLINEPDNERFCRSGGSGGFVGTYRGEDILYDCVSTQAPDEMYQREVDVIDSGTGIIWIDAAHTYPVSTASISWELQDRKKEWNVLSWLRQRKGKLKGFWRPSWNADFKLVDDISSTDTYLTVANYGYTDTPKPKIDNLIIITKTNEFYSFEITNSVVTSPDIEAIQLDRMVGVDLLISDINKICYLSFMRLNSDRIEFVHNGLNTNVSVPLFELPVEET